MNLHCVSFLRAEVFEDTLAVDQFLRQETGGGQHGQTSVLEFLGLHQFEFGRVGGLESEGIKTEVSGNVRFTQKTGLVKGGVLGFDPTNFGTNGFGLGDTGTQKEPKDRVDLGQVGNGRAGNLSVEEDRLTFDGFPDQETYGGKHGHTSVGEFGLTVTLQGWFVGLGGKTGRVEQTNGVQSTGDGVNGESRLGSLGGGFLRGKSVKGGSRRGEEGNGSSELHFDGYCLCCCVGIAM
mmetsp:Transcript_9270/g.18671  ORF Transcript_9270/g.18671 Transcript_9270/m.18671 type:complete len:236 (-) Transcript_9270:141-848(-)